MSRSARLAYKAAARAADPNRLVWERDGLEWPNRASSRFVRAAGLTWHVQQMGKGPSMLLVHGTGASTHSWGRIAPLLSRRFSVTALDLPGHAFTDLPGPDGLSLQGMADAVGKLLTALGISPEIVVGHSAGAAVLARMCLDRRIAPATLISLNGAFLPLRALPVQLMAPVTRFMVAIPAVSRFIARSAADENAVRRLLDGTGSNLRPEDVELYRRLFATPTHVAGALGMMANWRLETLEHALAQLKPALVLVAADNDRTIPPTDAARVRLRVPSARIVSIPGLGHLAHEEAPELVAEIIDQAVFAPLKRACV